MPGGFKIGTLTVGVSPDDAGFEDELRAQIAAAADGVNAEVGLRLDKDAPISLDEDIHAALDMVTAGVKAQVGLGLKGDAVGALDADVKAGVDLVEGDAKVKVSVDKKAAQDAGAQSGGLLMAAIAGGAALGAPAVLAAASTAFVGIEALALKSNQVITGDFTQLGKSAENALTTAAAPAAGVMHQALQTLETDVTQLQPQLTGLFANVTPDITAVTGGVNSFVSGALPGLSTALGSSQVIVSDFGTSLGTLGKGVGSFFTGVTRDATTTGDGLEQVVNLASSVLGTLGNVAGSASSAISADLMAIVPPADAALGAINKLASPATVGGAGGAFAAWKLGGPISTGLKSISSGLFDVAAKTEGAEGALGKVSGAALSGSSALEKMSGVMSGPWGIAIGAGVGLLSGLVGSLISAADATRAVTVSQQDLAKSVSQDGGAAGQATAAYIAATDASNGLSDTYQKAGVTTAQWTEAVLGNATAQRQVIDTITKANQAQQNQQLTTDENAKSTGKFSGELQGATTVVQANAAANNQLTDANQKVINSLNAQTKQVADAIAAQTKYEQAMAAVTSTEALFNASLTAAHEQLVANAQASALSTVGALDLGNAHYDLTSALDSTVTAYSEAHAEGSAYAQVLTALNGGVATLLGSEAAFTTSLSGVTAAVKANGTSLDVNTAKGAANITALSGIATAADKAAVALYENEVGTKGATVAFNDANNKLTQEKAAFEAAAEKAGLNKTQVKALADELFQIPKSVTSTVKVNTAAAEAALNRVLNDYALLAYAGQNAVQQEVSVIKQTVTHHATGGASFAGQGEIVGDAGVPEYFVPKADGYVYPSVAAGQRAIDSHNAQVAAAAPFPAANRAAAVMQVSQHFHGPQYPDVVLAAKMNHELATVLGGV